MGTKIYQSFEYEKIVSDLLDGQVVAFPTDTVYGLAIVYDNKDAFDKLYQIKNRSITKPISMMVASSDIIHKVAFVDQKSQKVIDKLLPGALTIILNAKDNLPTHVTFNDPTVGIRIPNHQTTLNILNKVNKPLLVKSANISNSSDLIKAEDGFKQFNGQITSLINEDATNGVASTVVNLTTSPIKVLRKGPIEEETILKIMEE